MHSSVWSVFSFCYFHRGQSERIKKGEEKILHLLITQIFINLYEYHLIRKPSWCGRTCLYKKRQMWSLSVTKGKRVVRVPSVCTRTTNHKNKQDKWWAWKKIRPDKCREPTCGQSPFLWVLTLLYKKVMSPLFVIKRCTASGERRHDNPVGQWEGDTSLP